MKNTKLNLILFSLFFSIAGCSLDGKIFSPSETGKVLHFKAAAPANAIVGQCVAFPVFVKDPSGNNVIASADITVHLESDGGLQFYQDNTCTSLLVSQNFKIPKDSQTEIIYVSNSVEQTNKVTISDISLSVQKTEEVIQWTPGNLSSSEKHLSLSGNASIVAGTCHPYTATLMSSTNVPVKSLDALVINLATTGGGLFFSDSGCSSSITQKTMGANQSFTTFYYKNTTIENVVLSAESVTVADATFSLAVRAPVSSIPTKLAIVGPSSLSSGLCSAAYYVKTLSSDDVEIPVAADTAVNLTGAGSGQFYFDASCLLPTSSVTITSGSSIQSFFYKNPAVENVLLAVDDTGSLAAGTKTVAATLVGTPPPTYMAVTGPTQIVAGQCSSAFTLKTYNGSNELSGVLASTLISLTGKQNGQFYSSANCTVGTEISSIILNSGEHAGQFFFKDDVAQSLVFGFSTATGIDPTTANLTIKAANPSMLILSGASSFNKDSCQYLLIQSRDAQGNAAEVASNKILNLTGQAAGSFYSDAACATSITSVALSAGNNNTGVYFKSSIPASYSLGVSDPSGVLSAGSHPVTVLSSVPAKLVLSSSGNATADVCYPMTVAVKDSANSSVVLGSNVSVTFTAMGGGLLYTNSSCSAGAAASVTTDILSGTNSLVLYYKNNVSGLYAISAVSAGLDSGNITISVVAANPTKLSMTGPGSVNAGACTGFTVKLQDANSNEATASANTLVNFAGHGAGAFYSDALCASVASSVIVGVGQNQALIYFKDVSTEALTLSATSVGLTGASLPLTVSQLGPSTLALTGNGSITAGSCSLYRVDSKDLLGNLAAVPANKTVTLAGASAGSFHLLSNCSDGSQATATIASGTSGVDIYYKNTTAENVTLLAQAAGMTQASKSVAVLPGAATKIDIYGGLSSAVGICNPFEVSILDSSNNRITSSSGAVVTLSSNGSGSFYTDASCVSATSSILIGAGSNVAFVYFKNTTAETSTLRGQRPGLVDGTLSLQTNSLPASQLVWSGAASVSAQACTSYVVTVKDSLGNSINVGSNLTINLSGQQSGTYYSDSGCGTSITQSTVLSGQSSTTIYYKNNTAENVNLTASASGFASVYKAVQIKALTPTTLALLGPNSITSNQCQAYMVEMRDSLGNATSLASAKTVNMTGGGDGSFYSDSACATSAGSFAIAANTSSSLVYYKANSGQNITMKATDLGLPDLPDVTLSIAVSGPPASGGGGGGGSLAIQFVETERIISEDSGVVTVTLMLSQPQLQDVSVSYAVSGTATRPQDHNLFPGTVVFPANSSKVTLSFMIYDDPVAESEETIILTLSSPSMGSIGINSSLTLKVQDNDGAGPFLDLAGKKYDMQFTKISMGYYHTCGLHNSGTLFCWGYNGYGQLGDGTTTDRPKPIVVENGNAPFTDVVARGYTTCGITQGNVKCWGYNNYGQLGDGTTVQKLVPTTVIGLGGTATSLILGGNATTVHACALVTGGALYCWGYNGYGQVGDGTTTLRSTPAVVTGLASGVTQVVAHTSGYAHMCAIQSGSLYCWGYNYYGQLGDGTTIQKSVPTLVSGLGGVTSVVVGGYDNLGSVCAIVTGGALYCWGYNGYGQLGDNSTASRSSPVAVSGMSSGVTQVSVGGYHTCAINNGSLFCWGYNGNGELGNGSTTDQKTPTIVEGLPGTVLTVATNRYSSNTYTCAIVTGGALYCWGYNGYGNLGDGTTTAQKTPVAVSGLGSGVTNVYLIQEATYNKTCALQNGAVRCWGYNGYGNLGDGTTTEAHTPVKMVYEVATGSNLAGYVVDVAKGTYHTCVILNGGSLKCWGYNYYGQLGDGTTTQSSQAVQVTGLTSGVTAVAVGLYHTCAIHNGAAKCWGYNGNGGVGDGTTTQRTTPTSVVGLGSGVTSIAVGTYFSCAAHNGAVKCWGYNNKGQLGDGTILDKSSPVDSYVGRLGSGVTQVVAGPSHACAVQYGGVKCWGYNGDGQLGDGTTTDRSPDTVFVSGLDSGVSEIKTGDSHSCAVRNGALYCWGYNGYGAIGDGTTNNRNSPVSVVGMSSGVTSVAVGYRYTCAVQNGALYCFGYNNYGMLGDGTTNYRVTPIPVPGLGSGVTKVSAQVDGTCALHAGILKCFGRNQYSQLGDGSKVDRLSPVTATASIPVLYNSNSDFKYLSNLAEISSGENHTCAALDGKAYCWGDNSFGQLGDGSFSSRLTPVLLSGFTRVKTITAGANHTCLINDMKTYCWGKNSEGEVGNGTTANVNVPTFNGIIGAYSIKAGALHTCALARSSSTYCWGDNYYGQLGTGTTTSSLSPVLATELSGAIGIASGYSFTCGVTSLDARCVGENSAGQMGRGLSSISEITASPVSGITVSDATQIRAGANHVCLFEPTSSSAWCWGLNSSGQLGRGNFISPVKSPSMINLPTGFRATDLQLGGSHSCSMGIMSDNSSRAFCWGDSGNGQLGIGESGPISQYWTDWQFADVVAVSASSKNSCIVRRRGQILCSGDNSSGQLGDGTTTNQKTPVEAIKAW